MNTKKIITLASVILAVSLGMLTDAYAGVDVKCEVRAGRSKISVDGFSLPGGVYRARVLSGNSVPVWSKNLLRPVAGETEFDFDSNRQDIISGATAISASYIKGGRATGQIFLRNANGTYSLKSQENSACKVR
jgi:hypothetical protein